MEQNSVELNNVYMTENVMLHWKLDVPMQTQQYKKTQLAKD